MDIQSIRKIIFPSVYGVINEIEKENYEIKVTMLRDIFNEAINSALNISHTNNTSIKAMFSGRGRAWAKINVSNDNPAWVATLNTLNSEILSSDSNSTMYKDCTNMIDLFENAGFAWVRFISSSKGYSKFQIRIKGSKLEDHIKLRIDNMHLLNNNVVNLEGVPHNLNLESGNFLEDEITKKEIINIPVSSEDLKDLGIQTLEDILVEG